MSGIYQDSGGGGGRHCPSPLINGNQSCSFGESSGTVSERWRIERFLATSCFIGQPLAFGADESAFRAGNIVNSKLGAVVVSKIKLGQIPISMLSFNMLIDADKTALEHGKETFERVSVDLRAIRQITHPLFFRVVNAMMFGNDAPVDGRSVRMKSAVAVEIAPQSLAHVAVVKEYRADRAATLDKTEHLPVLAERRVFGLTALRRPGNVCLVGFNDFAAAADGIGSAAVAHGVPDTVHQKPRGFHAAAKRALYLARRDAFLAATNQVDRLKPNPHRDVRRLKDRTHAHRERFSARAAVPQTGPRRLALGARRFADCAAMWALRTMRPQPRLDVGKCGSFVSEMKGLQFGLHGGSPVQPPFYL
jgi:hypothetical protein